MKIERAIIRRDADRPELAEGDRFQLEVDPEQMRAMFTAGTAFLKQIGQLLNGPPPKRRRRRGPRPRR